MTVMAVNLQLAKVLPEAIFYRYIWCFVTIGEVVSGYRAVPDTSSMCAFIET